MKDKSSVEFLENVRYLERYETVVYYDYAKPLDKQLHRRRLINSSLLDLTVLPHIVSTIVWNSSLVFRAGHEIFSSPTELDKIIRRIDYNFLSTQISICCNTTVGDIGFRKLDLSIDDLPIGPRILEDLIIFNNAMIDFQTLLFSEIINHQEFLDNSLIYNPEYRYDHFRAVRHDPGLLTKDFHRYMNVRYGSTSFDVSRKIVEQDLACHFLQFPDLFFELIGFYTLKGKIHE